MTQFFFLCETYMGLTQQEFFSSSIFIVFAQKIVSHYQFDEIFPDIVNLSKVDNLINV